jgi:succinate dehydrogenase / fumarate reductase, cytochrome b subunit
MNDVRDAQLIGKASDGRTIRRPLSPHIGVYRWPVTMAASILNRATGIALSAGLLFLVWWLVAAASGPAAFALVQEFLHSPLGVLMLLGWTASLFYHLFAGMRHLLWDSGIGFAKPGLNPVSWAVFGATGIATILVWVVVYTRLGG